MKNKGKTPSKENKGLIVAEKAGQLILSLLVLSAITFLISRLAPGTPLRSWYGEALERMSEEQRMMASEKLGLDQPLPFQYLRWMQHVLQGDFGISWQYKQPVAEVIGQVAGNTLLLTGVSFFAIFGIGLLTAVICVSHENHPPFFYARPR